MRVEEIALEPQGFAAWVRAHARSHHVDDRGGGLYALHLVPEQHAIGTLEALVALQTSATSPTPLVPGWSVYDAWATDGSYGMLLSCDADESDHLPAGDGDDSISGVALLAILDIAERSGCDFDTWRATGIPDRNTLMENADIAWETALEVFRALEASIGSEAFRLGCRELADLTSSVSPLVPRDVAGVLRFAHETIMAPMWRPLVVRVVAVRPGVTCVRLSMRAGLSGSRFLFASHTGTLESLPRHIGLPFASVPISAIEGEARATYLIRHESNAQYVAASAAPAPVAVQHDELLASRRESRRRASAELGASLATIADLHELADALFDGLSALVPMLRLELDIVSPDGKRHPFRRRGEAVLEGTTRRVLRHVDRVVGELRFRTEASAAGDVLAVLDLLQPWLSSAIGVAQMGVLAQSAAAAADEEVRALHDALHRAVERLERPAYLFAITGALTPLNPAAIRVTGSDASVAEAIATALGSGPNEQYETFRLPSEMGGLVLVRRDASTSLAERFDDLLQDAGVTARRKQVALMTLGGASVGQAAAALGIRESTVRSHLAAVYRALQVDGQLQLLAALLRGAKHP